MNNLRLLEPALIDPFDAMFRRFMAPMRRELDSASLDVRLDVTEVNDGYKVKADLPGVKKDDIHVRVDGNLVQIDAEVKQQKQTKDADGKVLCSERWQGAVSRAFTLAQDVDDARVKATFEDGVLTLELPKKAATTSKQITIE